MHPEFLLILYILIVILATKRITDLLVVDLITEPLRDFFGVEQIIVAIEVETAMSLDGVNAPTVEYFTTWENLPQTLQTGFIAKLLSCGKCTSVWVSLVVMVAVLIVGLPLVTAVLTPFALSCAVGMLNGR